MDLVNVVYSDAYRSWSRARRSRDRRARLLPDEGEPRETGQADSRRAPVSRCASEQQDWLCGPVRTAASKTNSQSVRYENVENPEMEMTPF